MVSVSQSKVFPFLTFHKNDTPVLDEAETNKWADAYRVVEVYAKGVLFAVLREYKDKPPLYKSVFSGEIFDDEDDDDDEVDPENAATDTSTEVQEQVNPERYILHSTVPGFQYFLGYVPTIEAGMELAEAKVIETQKLIHTWSNLLK